jgi:hypothetical protein
MVERIGGPSVMPYQPEGLWKELGEADYKQSKGEGLYRRSLYTFWKRTVAPPSMVTFDASPRERCSVRETRTNTPLQALVLMNEVTFIEAARALAQRIMSEAGQAPADRIILAFRLAVTRRPRPEELKILLDAFEDHLGRYRRDAEAALAIAAAGESARNDKLDPGELAAYMVLSSLILNLDETVTKE